MFGRIHSTLIESGLARAKHISRRDERIFTEEKREKT